MTGRTPEDCKPLEWARSSKNDLMAFPVEVIRAFGHDLWLVQTGQTPGSAKPLRGFGGADVLELVDDWGGDTYRVVYTVRFKLAIYVLHSFQKKAKRGVKTPQKEIDLVRSRLRAAGEDYARRYGDGSR